MSLPRVRPSIRCAGHRMGEAAGLYPCTDSELPCGGSEPTGRSPSQRLLRDIADGLDDANGVIVSHAYEWRDYAGEPRKEMARV